MIRVCPGRRGAAVSGAAPQPRPRRRIACVALAVSALVAGIVAAPTRSQAFFEVFADPEKTPFIADAYFWAKAYFLNDAPLNPTEGGRASEAAASVAQYATLHLVNFGATTEPGEPRFNGRMNRTIWGRFSHDRNRRVVIHTFGSDFDTALAVHTGKKVNKLTKVVFNDNYKVPGLSNTASLVQFDAEKETRYKIQLGSKTADEGSFYASIFVFPTSGGLAAFLAQVGGVAHNGRDYNCVIGDGLGNACGDPTFLLHNSTDKTLRIVTSSDLGPDVTAPAPFNLKPGKAKLATFTFKAGFDKTTIRTVAGQFKFVARNSGNVISRAAARALVVVKKQGLSPDVLQAPKGTPTVKADLMNAGNEFTVTLKNTGAFAAKGCHARANRFEYIRAIWQKLKSGEPAGDPNAPFNIPAGKSRTFRVIAGSMQYKAADPTFPGSANVVIDCANTAALALDLKSNFDFSAVGNWKTAELVTRILSPKNDTLRVPSSGQKSFKASAKSTGKNGTIIVRPVYRRPFDDDANAVYTASVCQLKKKNGGCKASPTFSVEYDTEKGVTNYFKVVVEAPANDPGFDATRRRVFLMFIHKRPAGIDDGFSEIPVAAESIAPKLF